MSCLPLPASPAFVRVRSSLIGYSDATLVAQKERLAQELDLDESDLDAVLAEHFQLERCSCCGHWFDQAHCNIDDGAGGFECASCATTPG